MRNARRFTLSGVERVSLFIGRRCVRVEIAVRDNERFGLYEIVV